MPLSKISSLYLCGSASGFSVPLIYVLTPSPVPYFLDCYSYICCCSVTQLCPTLCNPKDCSNQASLSFTISQSLLKLASIESVILFNHLVLCHPFSCLQSFPASGSIQMSQFFPSGGQSIGVSASASIFPVKD